MKPINFASAFAILLLASSPCFAVGLPTVSVWAPASFTDGERIYFNYTLYSPWDMEMDFVPHITCENNPVAFLTNMSINLTAGVPYAATYSDFIVGNRTSPGTCTASVGAGDAWGGANASTTFTINTLPILQARFATCADKECRQPKKVFVQGETVFIRGTSNSSRPITASSPDAAFSGPMAPANAALGYHAVSATASSPNYKPGPAQNVEYAVISGHPRIKLKNFAVKGKYPATAKNPPSAPIDWSGIKAG